MAAFDFEKNLTKKNIEAIFKMIDSDGNGSISREELRLFLNIDSSNPLLEEILEEVDSNKDGLISFEEFIKSVDNLFI